MWVITLPFLFTHLSFSIHPFVWNLPEVGPNAKHIVGYVKEGSRITGYKLAGGIFVSWPEAVSMAKQGQITGTGTAHQRDTKY